MRARWVLAAPVVVAALAFLVACQVQTNSASTGSMPEEKAAAAAERLASASGGSSYRFQVSATHTWSFEGTPQDWRFAGEGVRESATRFRSRLEGQADVFLVVEIDGEQVRAWDTRGPVPAAQATTAFGGPGPGTAPYTIVAYLTHAREWRSLGSDELDGVPVAHLSFVPNREAVAALDAAHQQAMQRVQEVAGEVWLDRAGQNIRRATARVQFLNSQGQPEVVVTTLDFQ